MNRLERLLGCNSAGARWTHCTKQKKGAASSVIHTQQRKERTVSAAQTIDKIRLRSSSLVNRLVTHRKKGLDNISSNKTKESDKVRGNKEK